MSSSTIAYLEQLIAFPTVSRDSNLALIDWYAARICDLGGRVRMVMDATGTKANLLASLGPEGAEDGIVLSGHSDVVSVDGQDWSSNPFELTAMGDNLFGRGTSDMKGFLAAMLSVARKAASRELRRPLHLLVSHDEEIGCVGVRAMLNQLAAEGFRAAGCVVGEPTGMKVATGHKGKVAARATCRGRAAHSADPSQGVNAIYMAAGFIGAAQDLQAAIAANGARDEGYPVPHSTVHVGTIAGGSALNIVPDRCALDFEIRLVPPDSGETLVEDLRARAQGLVPSADTGIDIDVLNAYPGLDIAGDDPFVALIKAASGSNETVKLSFGSEGGLIRCDLDMPVVVCGPGSIDRAHKPDEYITAGELAACDMFLERLLDRLCGL